MSPAEMGFSLTSFITELGLAWQKLSIYQQGHPEREQAVGRAHAVLVGLIAPTGSLSIGVSRDALIGPEEKLSSAPAVRLAGSLYLLEVAVIRFQEGIDAKELEMLLSLLPRGESLSLSRPLSDEMLALGVQNVSIDPVDFTGLVATDNLEDGGPRSSGRSMWDRILQRLLNDERLAAVGEVLEAPGDQSLGGVLAELGALLRRYGVDGAAVPGARSPENTSEILTALAGLVGETAGDHLADAEDVATRKSAVRHITELLAALPTGMRAAVLDGAIRELISREESAEGLRSLSGAVSAAQMVGSLRRLRAAKLPISPRMVSLVESLMVKATPKIFFPDGPRDPQELSQELSRIFVDEDVDRVGPGDAFDDRFFLELRRQVPSHARFADLDPFIETIEKERLEADLTATIIDLLQRPLFEEEHVRWMISRQRENFKHILASGRFKEAEGIVESLRRVAASPQKTKPVREAAEQCLDSFREGETLIAILDAFGDQKSGSLPVHRLIGLLGPAAIRELLGQLGEEAELSRRRQIFNLLANLGPAVVPPTVELMDDPRWYITRNCLSLLRQVGHGISLAVVDKGVAHKDSRVRSEAIKCLPELAEEVPRSLVETLLGDAEPKVAEAAVATFGSARMGVAVQPLAEMLRRPDPLGRQKEVRLRAFQTLGEIGDPAALPQIAQFFRGVFALVTAEERHAAFESLRFYPQEARAPWVKKGLWSPDKRVREICRSLTETGGKEG